MFIKEFTKFRKDVEKTVDSFFKMKPDELKEYIDECHRKYDRMYDLDKVSYKDVQPALKETVMRYRTMNYFYSIWVKLNELEPLIIKEDQE